MENQMENDSQLDKRKKKGPKWRERERERKRKHPSEIYSRAMFWSFLPLCFPFGIPFFPISGSEAVFHSIQPGIHLATFTKFGSKILSTVGTKIRADPENCFQELISDKLLIFFRGIGPGWN